MNGKKIFTGFFLERHQFWIESDENGCFTNGYSSSNEVIINNEVIVKSACLLLDHWSDWSKCSVPCGGGTMTRSRTCIDGCYMYALTDFTQVQACNKQRCMMGSFGNHGYG